MRTPDGTNVLAAREVLARAHDGSLTDLFAMRADQRSAVVTALAILSHVLRRYATSPLVKAGDWLTALRSQLGEDALVLAGGSDSRPQFFQPVIKDILGEVKPFNITETDHLMAANRHVLKVAYKATPEAALYGLMASTWRHHGGVGNPAGARSRLLTVLAGDGVTIASEIACLSSAYDAMTPTVVGIDAPAPKKTAKNICFGRSLGRQVSRLDEGCVSIH